jgi:hypothetical protein
MLDFFALCLLLIKFGLKLTRHSVVAVLSFFEIESNLVDIGESVEVLMLVEHLL